MEGSNRTSAQFDEVAEADAFKALRPQLCNEFFHLAQLDWHRVHAFVADDAQGFNPLAMGMPSVKLNQDLLPNRSIFNCVDEDVD